MTEAPASVPAATPAPAPRATSARRELTNTLLVMYVPVLVPIVTGMLKDSEHAQWCYVAMFPLVPGAIVPAVLQLDDAPFFVVAGAATALLCAILWLVSLRVPPVVRGVLRGAAVFAIGFEAIGLANLLRA